MKHEKSSGARVVFIVLMAVFTAANIAVIVYKFTVGEADLAMRGIFFPVFLLIPLIFSKIGIVHCWRFYIVLYLFLLFAYTYGSVWGAFKATYQPNTLPSFLPLWLREALLSGFVMDKVSHFLSGFLFTIVGLCLFYLQAGPAKGGLGADWPLAAGYGLFFSAFVAVVWEVFEFCDFALTGNDSQNHLATGVMDTMYDLMACLAASLLSVLSFILYRRLRLKLLTGWVMEEFYQKNVEGRPGWLKRGGGST